jgi:hypothetical protein
MRVSYRPSYAQFAENYLATHYSGGVGTLQRIAGGPSTILAGALLAFALAPRIASGFFRGLFILIGILLILAGLFYTFQPLINLFLVRLRREQLFGENVGATIIELSDQSLIVTEGEETLKLPIDQIKSIQHRAESTWLLTHGDYLIFVPREGLLEGDHDSFITELEKLLEPDEEG